MLNLPWKEGQRLGVRAGSRWPFTSFPEEDGRIHYIPFPFFLAYAASFLKKEGKAVKLIDAIAEEINEEGVIEKIKSFNPEFILAEVSTPSFESDIRIIGKVHNSLAGCQIAVCGAHASVFPKEILEKYNFIQYILIGEYEYALTALINCLEKNAALESVPGLVWRRGAEIKVNSVAPPPVNFNSFPWPERKSPDIYKYNDGFAGLPSPNVQMCASRGCSFQCSFCLWPQTIYRKREYRKRNSVDVVDEMEYLLKSFGFKAVYFDDDVFNIDRNYVLEICDEIIKRKIKIPWAVMARADLMDEGLLKAMSYAGLYAVKYGIESADQDILNFCKKGMDLNKAQRAVRLTKKFGVKTHLTFCLGLPGETRRSIRETVKFIRNTQPDSLQFSLATPFPGTEYFKYIKDTGCLLSEDWADYDGNRKCIIRTKNLSGSNLKRIKVVLNNSFNL